MLAFVRSILPPAPSDAVDLADNDRRSRQVGVAALAFIHKKNALSSDGFCHVGVSQDGMSA